MKLNKNAFPAQQWQPDGNGGRPYVFHSGMTLREYYAGLALQGLASNSDLGKMIMTNWQAGKDKELTSSQLIARDAVEMADALIAELNRVKTEATQEA
jgi:hypothetical protein